MSSNCTTADKMGLDLCSPTFLQTRATRSEEAPAADPIIAIVEGSSNSRTSTSSAAAERPSIGNTNTHNGLPGSPNKTPGGIVPVSARPADIICGRGLHVMNRQGNLNLHLLVNRHRQTYLCSTRRDKATITRNIVQEIKSTGARFLRGIDKDSSDDDRWVEVDDKTAYKKVSHALRLRDHGKNFSKSIEIQEKGNSSTTTTLRSAAPTPVEARTAHPPQHYGIVNGFGLSPSPSLGMMGLGSFLPPGTQLQSVPMHIQPRLEYARLQPQPVQGALGRHGANWYNNVMLDSRLVAEAFGMTLAIMQQAANQNRATYGGSVGSPQETLANVEEKRRHR